MDNLKNPFDKISSNDAEKFKEKCAEIAKELLADCAIKCGEKLYY